MKDPIASHIATPGTLLTEHKLLRDTLNHSRWEAEEQAENKQARSTVQADC